MFKLITCENKLFLIENPVWIISRKDNPNCFLINKKGKDGAEGIMFRGSPFLFKNGNNVYEFNSGDNLMTMEENMETMLIQSDEALIEFFEASL